MRLRITTPIKGKKVREKLVPLISNIEDENYTTDEYELVCNTCNTCNTCNNEYFF